MDDEQPSPIRRKAKFTPKVPPPRRPRTSFSKSEGDNSNEEEAAQAQKLMRKFNENLRRQVPKADKKSSVQVAFGPGAPSSSSLRSFGVPKNENPVSSGISSYTDDDGNINISSPSTVIEDGTTKFALDDVDTSTQKVKKDYRELWDYNHTYYPTILPLRRPYSGDPALLDEVEFGEAARKMEYDENTVNSAREIGLLEESNEEKLIFFQLPAKLPLVKRSSSAKGKEESSSTSQGKSAATKQSCLEGLSGGYMGKMLVYKSGAVKLKLGDILYDVSQGLDCSCIQDVVAINTTAKQCCSIGEIEKRAVVTPDVDSLLNSVVNLS